MESTSLWMGNLSAGMDEVFITKAFANMGYKTSGVKEIFNKVTGERATYCFVDFGDVNTAREVLIKLNGEPIPGVEGKKFKLNRSEYGRSTAHGDGIEYSLFVGDLTSDVVDNHLLDFFRIRYPSVRAAKVVIDEKGSHKGYGFVRFFNEDEINRALTEMQGMKGLGQRPIRVNKAVKSKNQLSAVATGMMDPNTVFPGWMQMQMHYMQQMYQFMQQCQEYAQQAADRAGLNHDASVRSPSVGSTATIQSNQQLSDQVNQNFNDEEDEEQPEYVDPNPHIDVEGMNEEFIDIDNVEFKIKHMMGRPISNRKSEPNTEDKRKSSFFRDKKKDRRNVYKSEFQKQIGNSKTGQGFAALQKKKILQKFNRTFKRKKGDNKVTSPITTNPLTESLDNSLHQDMLTDCGANETIVSGNITSHSRLTLDVENPTDSSKRKRKSHITNPRRIEIDYEKIHEERQKKAEEIRANIAKHEHLVAKSIEKRKKLAKRLSKRTARGQPVMAARMELLYEKISKT